MQKMILGRTGLEISRTGFGALPIQRVTFEEAAALLNRAVDGGICYIDTARAYTDSEEKIGRALSGRRSEFYIATKTHAKTGANLNADLETSLKLLNTDVIDVYQFHNPPFVPVARTASTTLRSRPGRPARSASSASRSTPLSAPSRRSSPGCTTRCNTRSTTWRPSAKSRWCTAARKRTSASWR